MSEVEAFLESIMPRLTAAETALANGDASPRMALWSHQDPVTLFGAAATKPEPVKEFETNRQRFFCVSFPIVGLLIHATIGSVGGEGRRWRNRPGLAA